MKSRALSDVFQEALFVCKGDFTMDELQFRKMIMAIVAGLYEKEQSHEKYPYSKHLIYGMDMLAALMVKQNRQDQLRDMHEAVFLQKYASKPVTEWFAGWNQQFLDTVCKYPLFQTEALIVLEEGLNYRITEQCADLYGNAEHDLFYALEQHHVFLKMKDLSPEDYTAVRKFLVEHPVCTEKAIRDFKIKTRKVDIAEILDAAYEDIPEDSYYCPVCGWTMHFHGRQAVCCNRSCTVNHPVREENRLIDNTNYKRLVHGVMRYMCIPGKLELEIQEKANKLGCKTKLWPNHDQYDIQITLPDGAIWAVDAKTHRNPYTLADSIRNDGAFVNVPADKRLYVIPKERTVDYPDYCDICRNALKGKDVDCITEQELYRMLKGGCRNGRN